jgi:hypothetical protein
MTKSPDVGVKTDKPSGLDESVAACSRRRRAGEVLDLLENETGMHSCAWSPNQDRRFAAGGKRRHPRGLEDTGIGADEPEA